MHRKICTWPSCKKDLIDITKPYCDYHRKYQLSQRKKERKSASQRGYDAAWAKFRSWKVKKAGGKCDVCGAAGKLEVDHIIPLSQGGKRLSNSNTQNLCKKCHSFKGQVDKKKYGEKKNEM